MIRKLLFKRKLKKLKVAKINYVKHQDFETAAICLEQEKIIQKRIEEIRLINILKRFQKNLFYVSDANYMRGIYFQHRDTDVPLKLPIYAYNDELNLCLECFFAEHPAFKFQWDEQPTERKKLVKEVTEYFILTEILDYFSKWDYTSRRKSKSGVIDTNNSRELINSNLFLRVICESIDHRVNFRVHRNLNFRNQIIAKDDDNKLNGIYHNFLYHFNYKCKVFRNEDKYIFSTPFMTLEFYLLNKNEEQLPPDFSKLVFGFDRQKAPVVELFLNFHLKRTAYFRPKYWLQIYLMHSVRDHLNELFSSEYFFEQFNWNEIYIQARVNEKIQGII